MRCVNLQGTLSISVAANVLFYKNITLSFLLFFFVILNKLQVMTNLL